MICIFWCSLKFICRPGPTHGDYAIIFYYIYCDGYSSKEALHFNYIFREFYILFENSFSVSSLASECCKEFLTRSKSDKLRKHVEDENGWELLEDESTFADGLEIIVRWDLTRTDFLRQ